MTLPPFAPALPPSNKWQVLKNAGGHVIPFIKKPWVAFGLPYLLIELFYIDMPVVRADGGSLAGWIKVAIFIRPARSLPRSVYGHVITKFSRMGRFP